MSVFLKRHAELVSASPGKRVDELETGLLVSASTKGDPEMNSG